MKKKRFSFEGVKHNLPIDDDIWDHTQQYVVDQMNIMKRHGSAPDPPLTQEQFNDLVYVTAENPQQIRNMKNAPKGIEMGVALLLKEMDTLISMWALHRQKCEHKGDVRMEQRRDNGIGTVSHVICGCGEELNCTDYSSW